MINYSIIAQVIVAVSIAYVWIFRFHNITKEFKQYGLSDLTRNTIGSAKIALSTLLVAGIWHPDLILIPALLIAFLMLSAQYFHFKMRHPWRKHIPSFLLLILSLFIVAVSLKLIEQ
ncbi:MAG: DoxX family protein [Chitinophagaceae bacterium]